MGQFTLKNQTTVLNNIQVDSQNQFYFFDVNATQSGQYKFEAFYKGESGNKLIDSQIDSVIVKSLAATFEKTQLESFENGQYVKYNGSNFF
jgi:hypothetical protein